MSNNRSSSSVFEYKMSLQCFFLENLERLNVKIFFLKTYDAKIKVFENILVMFQTFVRHFKQNKCFKCIDPIYFLTVTF